MTGDKADQFIVILQIRFMSRSKSSKHMRVFSPMKSPKYSDTAYFQTLEQNSELKLNDKIHKLKHALKAAEKHNQELHAKVKFYKQQNQEVYKLQEDLRRYKRKYENLHSEHDQNVLACQEAKLKLEYQDKQTLSKLKDGYEGQIRDLNTEIKTRDMKIAQLQAIQKDLQQGIQDRNIKIKQLQAALETSKMQSSEQKNLRLSRMQQDLQLKVTESHEYNRQISKLKQSLRDSLSKLEKANSMVVEQTQKNKILQDEQKQTKKVLAVLQKEVSLMREGSQKIKLDNLQKIEKISKMEKEMLTFQFQKTRQQQKYDEIESKYRKVETQLRSLEVEYQKINTKHQQTLAVNEPLSQIHYDLQREFQRELHTIIKELTRRHIVSKSLVMSVGSSGIYSASPIKPEENLNPHSFA